MNPKFKTLKVILLLAITGLYSCQNKVPDGFCHINDELPGIEIEARYASTKNFMGRVVDGYESTNLLLTKPAAQALKSVQSELNAQGLGLKIFDAYRPQRAVDHFVRWCADEADTVNKRFYYPNVAKHDLIPNGYIAAKSGHSRGSTVDLTLINLETGAELDMGTPWDYFGQESHPDYNGVTPEQYENRQLLQHVMTKHGFKPLPEEWWHFTLVNEPFPETYFNFSVE